MLNSNTKIRTKVKTIIIHLLLLCLCAPTTISAISIVYNFRIAQITKHPIVEPNKKRKTRQKKNAKRGYCRKKMQKQFRIRTYHRREIVESKFSSMKRMFGASVSSKSAKTIRAEVCCRCICSNLFYFIIGLLGQSRFFTIP